MRLQVIGFFNLLCKSGASSTASELSIGIPQPATIVEPAAIGRPAVTVVEISDPMAAAAGIELIDQHVVQLLEFIPPKPAIPTDDASSVIYFGAEDDER